MISPTDARKKISKIANKLDITKSNLEDILEEEKLGLNEIIGEVLLVDDKIKDNIKNMIDKLKDRGNSSLKVLQEEKVTKKENELNGTTGIEGVIPHINRLNGLTNISNAQEKTLTRLQRRKTELEREIENEKEKLSNVEKESADRHEEYKDIYNTIIKFSSLRQKEFLRPFQRDPTINLGGNKRSRDLKNQLLTTTTNPDRINFCSAEGKLEEKKSDNEHVVELITKSGNKKEFLLKGISIDTSNGIVVDFNNFQILDIDTNQPAMDIDYDKEIELGIQVDLKAEIANQWIASRKTFKIKPTIPLKDNRDDREEIYNNINSSNYIDAALDIKYRDYSKLQEESIWDVIKKAGIDVDNMDDKVKKQFMHHLKTDPQLTEDYFEEIPNDNAFKQGFKDHIINDPKNIPLEYLLSETKFESYLTKDIYGKAGDYVKKEVAKERDDEIKRRNLQQEFMNFQNQVENAKTDSHTERQDMESAIAGTTEMEPRRKEENYLKFFSNKSYSTPEQEVLVNSKDGTKVKYNMDVKVTGSQNFEMNLKYNGQEMTFKGGNHIRLIDFVLKNQNIPEGKARMHIAYNIMKSMLHIAKQANLPLEYLDQTNGKRSRIDLNGDNVTVKTVDHTDPNRIAEVETLFDQNDFNEIDDTRNLRIGLEKLAKKFNFAMKNVAKQHHEATKRRFMFSRKKRQKHRVNYKRHHSVWKGLLSARKNLNFDFQTSAQIPSVDGHNKAVQIDFESNKFRVTLGDKEYSHRNLANILRKDEFQGMEREIYGAIYKELISKLRTNSLVAKKNYGVYDAVRGVTYVLDSDGNWGYIPQEDGTPVGRKSGILRNKPTAMTLATNENEILQNPFLVGEIMKQMKNGMHRGSTRRGIVNKTQDSIAEIFSK